MTLGLGYHRQVVATGESGRLRLGTQMGTPLLGVVFEAFRTEARNVPVCLRVFDLVVAGMRVGAAFGHAEDPLDGFEIHLLNVRVVPSFFGVSEG